MRSSVLRRGLQPALAIAMVGLLLGGCASPAKRQYLRHLSVTIAPLGPDDTRAVPTARDTEIAVAETGGAGGASN